MNSNELGLIGSILLDPDCIKKVYDKVTPEMFDSLLAEDCYREMLGMSDHQETINAVALCHRLENHKHDANDVLSMLKNATVECVSSVYIDTYADNLILDYKARETKAVLQRVSLAPKDIINSIGEIMVELDRIQESKVRNSRSVRELCEQYKENYFRERPPKPKTGFYKLDSILWELEAGDVTVIGARPAVGKSAFIMQMILQMAERKWRVGYFNLEMNENQVYERMISCISGLSLTRIRRAVNFLNDEQQIFEKANQTLNEYDIDVITGSAKISDIRKSCKHRKYDVVVIDYLQLISGDRQYGNRASEVGEISKAIKGIARDFKVPVIVLSQLNRDKTPSSEPTMAELRESGDIEQDASNIVLLWNLSDDEAYDKGLKVDKNRMGELGKIALRFNGERMRFEERSEPFEKYVSMVKGQKAVRKELAELDDDECPFT